MKALDLKKRSDKELHGLLEEKRARLEELSFLMAQGKVKNVKESAALKKDIARIFTVLKGVR
ncbi:MAG: 50S ribosomal protein L29 [Candidatus Sungbacteria bacterium RIFCSPLOWO2_02_FULL_51_17]|uniref:Large ribosomal subunit protein uL29 n=1 Tax=Candidatus Sungbacteria bacterium RIFCSPHIGHO2_02_FULL_51_29 TaxID=1802273 RepID=A0A1G2KSQ6_9BACT|nr:MAG: 50S ribosomal protein L29 [Candidatus Sungbacteria bacterium RIFCSPHIGHO2_01_FULL_51_22]OHA02488.1 MAG: 50S ribosomal protein L29 [Candidatus Sungbacteria bacterium RIFCSPHIGHO2_02_FULL_51_29]OHA07945.1 MAG: 50S ribosomal protein L29 [Candidatus Sungbacteria bacterium RIFCSPLOWO2_01_FULL_51_34]OHA11935.1 MAG: 50S ribosomal protein L29 [Candidatus Sungbacteria bacterium RIFCSPLOWO2_02_FULL_51_17]